MKANDLRASVVVFLVALPLCLGIALASNAPLSSGILAGIVGGLIIGALGGSQVSVSGPAAGLTVIVAAAIHELGSFPAFTVAVMLAGIMQIFMGFLKAGELGNFFPSSVIKGMLAAIGLILILKQIPHAVGWDADYMGDHSFTHNGENTFTSLFQGLRGMHTGATFLGAFSIGIMLFWDKWVTKKMPAVAIVPSPLLAVVGGVVLNEFIFSQHQGLAINPSHLVTLPFTGGFGSLFQSWEAPMLGVLSNYSTWKVAFTLALVGSLETLLSLDAADKIDPLKRISHKNKELRAQGVGNFLSGLIGGLPVTAVIVRTSANVSAGGLSRKSAIVHGLWLLLAVSMFPDLLNKIPLAVLAAVLILIGWKLTKPSLIKEQWKMGLNQFIPFAITIIAILFTDLLVGIGIGLLVGIFFVLKTSAQSSVMVINHEDHTLVRFSKDVSFLQKARLRKVLRDIPDHRKVVIDGSRSICIDHDIIELVKDFVESSTSRGITVSLQKSPLAVAEIFKV